MEQILKEIELLRSKMIEEAKRKGLTDPCVLQLSRRIDQLHNHLLMNEESGYLDDHKRIHTHKIFEIYGKYAV